MSLTCVSCGCGLLSFLNLFVSTHWRILTHISLHLPWASPPHYHSNYKFIRLLSIHIMALVCVNFDNPY